MNALYGPVLSAMTELEEIYGPIERGSFVRDGQTGLSVTPSYSFEYEGVAVRWVMMFYGTSMDIVVLTDNNKNPIEIMTGEYVGLGYEPTGREANKYPFSKSIAARLGAEFSLSFCAYPVDRSLMN